MDIRQARLPGRHLSVALDGLSGSSTAAREYARGFLDASVPPLSATVAQDALILVSELVSNAVRHAPGPCTLSISDDGRQFVIAVSDTSTTLPTPRRPDLAAGTGGFGWHLLQRLAQQVEIRPRPKRRGKIISATLIPFTG